MKRFGALAKMYNLWAPYNSSARNPNFTKCGHDGSLDIVVVEVVLVFQEFLLVSTQWQSKVSEEKIQKISPVRALTVDF